MKLFDIKQLKNLYRPANDSTGEDNGQVTIIGGSKLFHGAPLLSLKVASRIVDMVFFATPEKSVGYVSEQIKSQLFSFIWIPWEDVDAYIEKSDAVLIGPGFMRFESEHSAKNIEHRRSLDGEGIKTREITENFLKKFPNKRWVIDAGSLQVVDPELLPKGCIVTPNKKEYKILFGNTNPGDAAKKYKCYISLKGAISYVYSPDDVIEVRGGNQGMTKAGTGDVLAGLTVALLAKNDPFLAASSASYIVKRAADELHKKFGVNYNADDLADKIPSTFKRPL